MKLRDLLEVIGDNWQRFELILKYNEYNENNDKYKRSETIGTFKKDNLGVKDYLDYKVDLIRDFPDCDVNFTIYICKDEKEEKYDDDDDDEYFFGED